MTMIEGIGDEVVQFMVVVLIVVIASVAWWSTNARPNRYRTVLVMRSRAHHPVTVSIRTRPNTTIQTNDAQESTRDSTPTVTYSGDATNTESATNSTTPPVEPETPRNNDVIPLQEMDSIIDADMAMLDNNRLHFYRRIDAAAPHTTEAREAETSDQPGPASNDQIREMDSIVSAMEADVTDGCEFFARPNAEPNPSLKTGDANSHGDDTPEGERPTPAVEAAGGTSVDITSNADARKILIKLKYLNETLKEVEGSLDELLKDFKRRHFSAELSSERRVRLIFNGRVLDEAATLRALGLHHRAVVHCLVHPHRPAAPQQQNTSDSTEPADFAREIPQDRWMDLENLLMTLVSVALTVVWFFRCEYSNMFTASASVALFALTVFYSVAIFGLYLSDTFHFDRRPNQPVPNN